MDINFTIFMGIFSGCIWLYALILAITKNYNLLPVRATVSVRPNDTKAYTFQLAKCIALTGSVPLLTGLSGLIHGLLAGFVFVFGLIFCLWLSTKLMKNQKTLK